MSAIQIISINSTTCVCVMMCIIYLKKKKREIVSGSYYSIYANASICPTNDVDEALGHFMLINNNMLGADVGGTVDVLIFDIFSKKI